MIPNIRNIEQTNKKRNLEYPLKGGNTEESKNMKNGIQNTITDIEESRLNFLIE
ncbi:MAG: hypothetical protein R6U35_03795 [Candidatus Humimicrobiaceae bacterium]